MYNLVRWVIFVIVMGSLVLLIRKRSFNKVIKSVLLVVVALILFSLWNIPFENYFLSFETLEKSFSYYVPQQDIEILKTFEGENSGMLIYKSVDGYANYIAYKDEKGWKIGNSNTNYIESQKVLDRYSSFVYKVEGTEDRYIWITASFVDDSAEITDSNGKRFESVKHGSHVSYYFYTNEDFDYTVVIDGVVYSLKD